MAAIYNKIFNFLVFNPLKPLIRNPLKIEDWQNIKKSIVLPLL